MDKIPGIESRLEIMAQSNENADSVSAIVSQVKADLAEVAKNAVARAGTHDVGRLIAFLDALMAAGQTFESGALLGADMESRKRRRQAAPGEVVEQSLQIVNNQRVLVERAYKDGVVVKETSK